MFEIYHRCERKGVEGGREVGRAEGRTNWESVLLVMRFVVLCKTHFY